MRVLDATRYDFTGDERVVYLFNPFDGVVLARVMENMLASLARQPRELWLVYHNPVWREVIDQSGAFHIVGEWIAGGARFAVYRSGSR